MRPVGSAASQGGRRTPTLGVPKPQRTTQQERKAIRERNPLKPTFGKRETVEEGPPPSERSSLKPFSKKRLEALKKAGLKPSSTFTPKPGRKRLERPRKCIQGQIIRTVTTKPGFVLKKGQPMKREGARGRRMAAGDRKARAECIALPCVCGCRLPPQWAHLESRRIESTRHLPWNSVPACHHLHGWLDQGKGTAVRPLLLEMAKELGRRLTHEDIMQTLSDNGYYAMLAERRTRER